MQCLLFLVIILYCPRAVLVPSLGALRIEVDEARSELEERQRELEEIMETVRS